MTTSTRLVEPRSTASFSPESSLVFQTSRDSAETAAVDGFSAIRGHVTPVVGAAGDSIARAEATGAAVTSTKNPARTIAPTIRKLSALRAVVFDIRFPLPDTESVRGFARAYKSIPQITEPDRPAILN